MNPFKLVKPRRPKPTMRGVLHAPVPPIDGFPVLVMKTFSLVKHVKIIPVLKQLVDTGIIKAFYASPRFKGHYVLQTEKPAEVVPALPPEIRVLFQRNLYLMRHEELLNNVNRIVVHKAVSSDSVLTEYEVGMKVLFKPPGGTNFPVKRAKIIGKQGDSYIITLLGANQFPLPVITTKGNIVQVVKDQCDE